MKLHKESKEPKAANRFVATLGELAVVYVGPPSLILATERAVVPVISTVFAYSYDYALRSYRWTLSRPLCEGHDRIVEKIRRTARGQGSRFGLGVVFNGQVGAPQDAHRRGVWLGDIPLDDVTEGVSVAMQQPVVDVASGLAGACDPWPEPPFAPWTALEF